MERQMIRQIRTLAHKECCNYIDGKCICHGNFTVINPRYPSIHDGAIDCDYFLECVLPIDPELNRIVWGEFLCARQQPTAILSALQTAPRAASQPAQTAQLLSKKTSKQHLIVTGWRFKKPCISRFFEAVSNGRR